MLSPVRAVKVRLQTYTLYIHSIYSALVNLVNLLCSTYLAQGCQFKVHVPAHLLDKAVYV